MLFEILRTGVSAFYFLLLWFLKLKKKVTVFQSHESQQKQYEIYKLRQQVDSSTFHRNFFVLCKESTETYLLELTPYKGLCIVVCLLNGQ